MENDWAAGYDYAQVKEYFIKSMTEELTLVVKGELLQRIMLLP